MGRHKADIRSTFGPKVWARFLKFNFNCDLNALNSQLLFPVETNEKFQFGITPRPICSSKLPRVFQRAHDLGKNPNGIYTSEIFDDSSKYNLYERVTERIPESKNWLLLDLLPLFDSNYYPDIEFSFNTVNRLFEEWNLTLMPDDCLDAWTDADLKSLDEAESVSLNAISNYAHPDSLAILFYLYHLYLWQNMQSYNVVINKIKSAALKALVSFRELNIFNSTDDYILASSIYSSLSSSLSTIQSYGVHSKSKSTTWGYPKLPRRIVFMNNSVITQKSIESLYQSSNPTYGLAHRLMPELFGPFIDMSSPNEVRQAISVVTKNVDNWSGDLLGH